MIPRTLFVMVRHPFDSPQNKMYLLFVYGIINALAVMGIFFSYRLMVKQLDEVVARKILHCTAKLIICETHSLTIIAWGIAFRESLSKIVFLATYGYLITSSMMYFSRLTLIHILLSLLCLVKTLGFHYVIRNMAEPSEGRFRGIVDFNVFQSHHIENLLRSIWGALFYFVSIDGFNVLLKHDFKNAPLCLLLYITPLILSGILRNKQYFCAVLQFAFLFAACISNGWILLQRSGMSSKPNHLFKLLLTSLLCMLLAIKLQLREEGSWREDDGFIEHRPGSKV